MILMRRRGTNCVPNCVTTVYEEVTFAPPRLASLAALNVVDLFGHEAGFEPSSLSAFPTWPGPHAQSDVATSARHPRFRHPC
jgi:hypothetical protein